MDRRKAILWGLGAAQLVAGAIGYVLSEWASNIWVVVTGQVVFLGLFYLAGAWVALGRKYVPWRLVAVGVILTCLTWLHGRTLGFLVDNVFIMSPGMITVVLALDLLRMLGFHVKSIDGASLISDSNRLQFSLRSILIWTAAVAILLSLGSLVHPDIAEASKRFRWQEILFLFLPIHALFTSICVADLAIILGMRRPLLAFAGLVLVSLLLSVLIGRWIQAIVAQFVWAGGCATLWFAACFLPLRLLGYRFARRRPASQQVVEAV